MFDRPNPVNAARYNPPLGRSPLDYERHQVQALYGRASTERLAHMQEFCDEYGEVDRATVPGGENRQLRTTAYRE